MSFSKLNFIADVVSFPCFVIPQQCPSEGQGFAQPPSPPMSRNAKEWPPSVASLWRRWEKRNFLDHINIVADEDVEGGFFWRRFNSEDPAQARRKGEIVGFEMGLLPRPGMIDRMLARIRAHPMTTFERVFWDERKLKDTKKEDHLSFYNITLTTNFNAFITIGYSWHDGKKVKTKGVGSHLWAAHLGRRGQENAHVITSTFSFSDRSWSAQFTF
jgi:hypothetical protein